MTDQDPFADPTSDFSDNYLKMEDLLERTIIVIPELIQTEQSTMPGNTGKTYDVAVSDVIVLDGGTNEKIPTLPHFASNFWITGAAAVNEVRSKAGTGTPIIAKLTRVPSQTKGFGPRYELAAVGTEVKQAQTTKAAWKQYKDQKDEVPF